jgi:hypothetical protein
MLPAPSREAPDDLIGLPHALAHMPHNQRRAILLREWQGLSYHEIADELNLSQSAVETLIFRARRTLASNLQSEREQPSGLTRARKAFDFGALLAALKGLFEGGAAVKVATVAVAASSAVVVTTTPQASLPAPASPKQTVTSVVQAAQTAPPVLFQSSSTAAAVGEPKHAPAASAPRAPKAAPAAAAALQQPKKQKAEDAPKATPPGRAKKQEIAAKTHGRPVKAKKSKDNGKRSIVAPPPPTPVQAAAPAAEQPVAVPPPAEAPTAPEKSAKGPKK